MIETRPFHHYRTHTFSFLQKKRISFILILVNVPTGVFSLSNNYLWSVCVGPGSVLLLMFPRVPRWWQAERGETVKAGLSQFVSGFICHVTVC